MARPLRIEYSGAFYHIINRGLERRNIFRNHSDYLKFLDRCVEIHRRYGLIFYAYCLMPNHYHLLVETPQPNLQRAMRHLDAFYTQDFNRAYRRIGPLFQGRYKAILVDKDSYLLEVARYIHLNPVKANLVTNAKDYQYSSFQHYMTGKLAPTFLKTDFLLGIFSKKRRRAINKLINFTLEGLKGEFVPMKAARHGVMLGSDDFCQDIQEKFIYTKNDPEISELNRLKKEDELKVHESIARSMSTSPSEEKKLLAYCLRFYSPLTLKEIQKKLGVSSHHAVSKTVERLVALGKNDKRMKAMLQKIESEMSHV